MRQPLLSLAIGALVLATTVLAIDLLTRSETERNRAYSYWKPRTSVALYLELVVGVGLLMTAATNLTVSHGLALGGLLCVLHSLCGLWAVYNRTQRLLVVVAALAVLVGYAGQGGGRLSFTPPLY